MIGRNTFEYNVFYLMIRFPLVIYTATPSRVEVKRG